MKNEELFLCELCMKLRVFAVKERRQYGSMEVASALRASQ